jgi:hypothetical protein
MDDLAEKALQGLDVARRRMAAHPMSCFAALGFLVAAGVVVAGGQVNAARPTQPISSWFGLQQTHGVHGADWVPGLGMLLGIAALVLLWIAVVSYVGRRAQPDRRLWWLAAAWAAPFAVGPPLLGTTVQTYVAFGELQRHGLSPYAYAPNRLGTASIVTAIEPAARDTVSSAGPLGSLLQHVAVSASAGSALAAIVVLRAVAVLAAVAIGRFAAELAGARRPMALSLTILNPLLLLFVISAAHLDGVMIALVLGALRAVSRRRWVLAIVLACVGGSVAGPAFVAVPAIIAAHLLARRSVRSWLLIAGDLAAAAVTIAVCGLIVHDGFGWLWTVSKQFAAHPPYSIAGAIAKLLDPVVRGASYDDLAAGARITAMTAMVCVVVYLIATSGRRPLERSVGYGLLAVALLAPVLYPWYLLWGLLCLAPTASRTRRVVVLSLTAGGCFLLPEGFSDTTGNVLTGVALAVVAAAVLVVARRRPARQAVSA